MQREKHGEETTRRLRHTQAGASSPPLTKKHNNERKGKHEPASYADGSGPRFMDIRMKENAAKAAFTAIVSGVTLYFQEMLLPVVVLLCVILGDYVTGMIRAWIKKEISSRTGVVGVVKKLCYLLLVCVGMGIDWVIRSGLSQVGIEPGGTFAVGIIVTIWLIINELISILENLATIGTPVPSFMLRLIDRLKIAVENKSESGGHSTAEKEQTEE